MSAICEEPIVAIVCEDKNKVFHVFHCEKPILLQDININHKTIEAVNLSIIISTYESVVVCTQAYLDQMREKLKIA